MQFRQYWNNSMKLAQFKNQRLKFENNNKRLNEKVNQFINGFTSREAVQPKK